jgi:hypothetical protein
VAVHRRGIAARLGEIASGRESQRNSGEVAVKLSALASRAIIKAELGRVQLFVSYLPARFVRH